MNEERRRELLDHLELMSDCYVAERMDSIAPQKAFENHFGLVDEIRALISGPPGE